MLAAAAASAGASAQEAGPIATDRPSITDGVSLMSPGAWQLEAGWTYTVVDERHDLGAASLRLGLTRRFEVRVGIPAYTWLARGEGFQDASIGARVLLRSGEAGGATLQTTFGTTLPTGSDLHSPATLQPFASLTASLPVAPGTSVGSTVRWSNLDDGEARWSQWVLSAAAFHALTERLSGFLEIAVQAPSARDDVARPVFDGGLMLLLNDSWQLDVNGGVILRDGSSAGFVGAGLGIRF